MPWSNRADATRHTRKADTAAKQDAWLKAANEELARSGNDGLAVRAGNSAVKKIHAQKAKR